MSILPEYATAPATVTSAEMIAVRGLTKRIGRQEILRGVDLDVAVGETLAIIGRSGGGKTILLKHLVGLMQPNAGEIWIEGQNITGAKRARTGKHSSKDRDSFSRGGAF